MPESEPIGSYKDTTAHNPGFADKFILKIPRIPARSGISYGDIGGMTVRNA